MIEYLCPKCYEVTKAEVEAPSCCRRCGDTLVPARDAFLHLAFRYEVLAEYCRRRERRATWWSLGGLGVVPPHQPSAPSPCST